MIYAKSIYAPVEFKLLGDNKIQINNHNKSIVCSIDRAKIIADGLKAQGYRMLDAGEKSQHEEFLDNNPEFDLHS